MIRLGDHRRTVPYQAKKKVRGKTETTTACISTVRSSAEERRKTDCSSRALAQFDHSLPVRSAGNLSFSPNTSVKFITARSVDFHGRAGAVFGAALHSACLTKNGNTEIPNGLVQFLEGAF
jgi:hypothetical protein